MMPQEKHPSRSMGKDSKDKLSFEYLPRFAIFILDHHLEAYVRDQLTNSFEEKIPILKFFAHLTEEELVQRGLKSNHEFFSALAENRIRAFIIKSADTYIKNQISFLEREQVVAEDITIVSFIRRKTLRKYLQLYTSDVSLFSNVMEEIDRYITENETVTINAYLQIQHEKITLINCTLEQRENELLEAQELADMGSFLWDLQGKGSSAYTPGVLRIFEMTETSSLESFFEYVHEEDRQKLKEAIERSFHNDGIYECAYRFIKNNKQKKIWSRGKVTFQDGRAVYMKGTVMDVTKKDQLLQQLQESERLHQQAQAQTHIGNWVWHIESNTIEWSDEMYRIYGLQPQSEEINFERFMSFVHPEDREKRSDEIQSALRTGIADDYVMRIVNPDGTLKILSGKGQVITDRRMRPIKLVGTCQDITWEHNLNQELQVKNETLEFKNIELERMNKELESFNYIASHDLQEPLRKIQIFTNRILENGTDSLPHDAVEYLSKIAESSSRMKMLITDLLTFSQTTNTEQNIEITDLNEVLEEVKNTLSTVIEEKKVIIESSMLPVLPIVPFQIHQVMLNIIMNGIKYSKPEIPARIKLTSGLVKGEQIKLRGAVPSRKYVELIFEDNGIGFDESQAEKIFGLFYRLHSKDKYSGTGIGLAICKKMVQNHNGFILARSKPGIGSAFYVYLPGDNQSHSGLHMQS